jgi:hypothetical protein
MVILATLTLALADCLERLEGDPAGLEACIGKYAGHQEELRALLRVAAALKQVPEEAAPRDGFLDDLRSMLMKQSPTNSAKGGEAE